MKLWVKALLADPDVDEMDLEEFGAYMRLLMRAWLRGGIPADPGRRRRILKVSATREASLWEVLESKWEPGPDGLLVNPRQERERAEALAKSEQARRAAEKRWGQAA